MLFGERCSPHTFEMSSRWKLMRIIEAFFTAGLESDGNIQTDLLCSRYLELWLQKEQNTIKRWDLSRDIPRGVFDSHKHLASLLCSIRAATGFQIDIISFSSRLCDSKHFDNSIKHNFYHPTRFSRKSTEKCCGGKQAFRSESMPFKCLVNMLALFPFPHSMREGLLPLTFEAVSLMKKVKCEIRFW